MKQIVVMHRKKAQINPISISYCRIPTTCHQEHQCSLRYKGRRRQSRDPRLRLRPGEHLEPRVSGQVVLQRRPSGLPMDSRQESLS